MVFAPPAFLAAGLAAELFAGSISGSVLVASAGRRAVLLVNSVQLSAAVAVAGTLVGLLAASTLWSLQGRLQRRLRWLVLLFAAVPPYIHALSWSTAATGAARLLSPVGIALPALGGWGGSWWVQIMAFLPLAVGLALLGLETVDPQLLEAARAHRPDVVTFTRIALPLAAPVLLAGCGFLFVFSLMDYSIPSLFGKSVYALEIFAEHSASGQASTAFLAALPLLIPAAAVVTFSQAPLREAAQRPSWKLRPWGGAPVWPRWLRGLQGAALLLVALQIAVPLGALTAATGSWEALAESVRLARREILFSLAVAGVAALAALPLAYAAAARLAGKDKRRRIWWLLATVPLAVPAPLVGIGLIAAWNRPLFGEIYGSAAMPVLAALARFAPLAALLLAAELKRTDPLLLDAARLMQRRPADTFFRVRLPLLAPGLLAAAAICFALTLGELGATLIVAPPGMATLTMRLYNLLHYGATEMVAGLCLVMAVVTAAAGAGAFVLLTLWSRFSGGEGVPHE